LRHRLHVFLAAACAAAAPAARAADVLPDASVRIEATRYIPADSEQQWLGWIGAGATLVRSGGASVWGRAEVETILGHVIRPFEATQANYHLSFGLRFQAGRLDLVPFFRHVSRHDIDRPKTQAVDWNLLGLEASGRVGDRVRVLASLGRTTQASLPGYEWEARAAAEAAVWRQGEASALLRGALRLVTVREEDTLPRGDFADWTLEGALRWEAAGRALETYVSAEKRNDVFLETPGARQRALLGLRVLYNRPRPHLQLGP
jgi:hypothetical protein